MLLIKTLNISTKGRTTSFTGSQCRLIWHYIVSYLVPLGQEVTVFEEGGTVANTVIGSD